MSKGFAFHVRAWTNSKDASLEKMILSHWCCDYKASKCVEYSRNILKKRWRKAENFIAKHPYQSYLYARYVIKDRWPKAEAEIIKDPQSAYLYARYVIEGKWPEAENAISSNFKFSYLYAKYVIKSRFVLGEKNFKDLMYIYKYAKDVIKGRWLEMEDRIFKDTSYSHHRFKIYYVVDIIKQRCEELEFEIIQSDQISSYCNILKGTEKEEFMNKIIATAMSGENETLNWGDTLKNKEQAGQFFARNYLQKQHQPRLLQRARPRYKTKKNIK